MNAYYKIFNSEYGAIAILWILKNGLPKISRIHLNIGKTIPIKDIKLNNNGHSCTAIDDTIKKIQAYFSGKIIHFDLDVVDLDICSHFEKKVLLAEYSIPRGHVSTYKKIGDYINKTDSARAVGNASAKNPFPIIIPCHRIIKSDGSLGGYGGGIRMKYQLLKMEGITFDARQKILHEQIYY